MATTPPGLHTLLMVMLNIGGHLVLQINQSLVLTMIMLQLTKPHSGTTKLKKLELMLSKLPKDTTVLRLVKSHFHAPSVNTLTMKVQSNAHLVLSENGALMLLQQRLR
jgi:hypothetical protein